jgi:predicted metal-binding membrane protein
MKTATALDTAIGRDRALAALGLIVLTSLAWLYLARDAASMNAMAGEAQMHRAMGMADMRSWGVADWFGLFTMWTVMMAAMMLPSAAPVILLVLGVYRRRNDSTARLSSLAFVAGYLIVWTAFSLAASASQTALHRNALLAPDMRSNSAVASGVVLVMAGVYQWLPFKNTCLTHCRSPLGFLSLYWREGPMGGLSLGARHGLFCVGCCWLLMALLFVVGVMNLVWVAALAGFVLIEKVARGGDVVGRVAGLGVAAWGVYLLTSA